jgi:hypothetical protein
VLKVPAEMITSFPANAEPVMLISYSSFDMPDDLHIPATPADAV